MKKSLFLGLFLLQALFMSAQYSIKVEPFTLAPGASADDEENPAYFEISINYGEEEQARQCQFNMVLPEGITVPEGYIELDENRFPMQKDGRQTIQPFTVSSQLQNDGSVQVIISTQKNFYFTGNEGVALRAYCNVDENMQEGEYEISIYNGVIAIKDAPGGGPDGLVSSTIIKVEKNISDGIRSINADGTTGDVYNTAGQRVSRTTKGLYIQNGKKVVKK